LLPPLAEIPRSGNVRESQKRCSKFPGDTYKFEPHSQCNNEVRVTHDNGAMVNVAPMHANRMR